MQFIDEQNSHRAFGDIIVNFERFAKQSLPVGTVFLVLLAQVLASLAAWNLASDYVLALVWPAAIGLMAEFGWRILIGFACGLVIVQVLYWGVGSMFAGLSNLAGINLSTQSLRHLLLFAGLPLYMVAIVDGIFFWGTGVLVDVLSQLNVSTYSWEKFSSLTFKVLLWGATAFSISRFSSGVAALADQNSRPVILGIIAPSVLLAVALSAVFLPTPITQRMADNIELQYRADEAPQRYRGNAERYFAVARRVIPEIDVPNHLRFIQHTRTEYDGTFSYASVHEQSIAALVDLARPGTKLHYQLLAADAKRDDRMHDYIAACENLVALDSTDDFHRRALVDHLLDHYSHPSMFDPQAAKKHALYLKLHKPLRRDVRLWGKCHYYLGDYKRAYKILHPLMMADSQDNEAVYYVALASKGLGRYQMALRCLEINLANFDGLSGMTIVGKTTLGEMIDSVRALRDWKRAPELEPESESKPRKQQ